ncbi:AAA domain-containing protein [Salinicola sp. JS01]|uniref:DEAD/DEAH box helicase n=1 Tax=Salinicola sp. JS01 TaxID=3050071 RepID=UPI00255B504C|nr:AAA domain-containing protein [Salinicola sp. JS01]WIX32646.1 AAA domain-containing protein [Salinicola sp. JS01]
MTSSPSPTQAERILSFWHKVEFFESAELKDIDDGKGAIHYRSAELVDTPDCLPWLNAEHVRRAGRRYRPGSGYRYKLYLGLFKRSEIFAIARDAYPSQSDAWVERSRDEGLTCSLTVKVKQDGVIDRESFKISTATWVLGALQQGCLDTVTLEAFEAASEVFRERLNTILTVADNLKHEHALPLCLTPFELIEMLKAMQSWTAFSPGSDAPAVVVQVCKPKKIMNDSVGSCDVSTSWTPLEVLPRRLQALTNEAPSAPASDMVPGAESEAESGAEEVRAPEDALPLVNELDILNSFYIRDLERVLAQAKERGLAPGSPLARYLQGPGEKKPDLLLSEGKSLLMRNLAMERMPLGRWPGEDAHAMSLMQQFAINTIDEELAESGLYSVNGPPGTGKTTMLRDLVASNVVKRATVLAGLSAPEAAFEEDIEVKINDQPQPIKTLIPELTGFEMVVASSNNAAVENVTRELPQAKALGAAYRELGYLKPVAQKLAAEHDKRDDGKTHVEALTSDKDCWGLIATSLGKKGNRDTFGERVFFTSIAKCEAQGEAEHYSTLIPTLKALAEGRDAKRDFKTVQHAFREAQREVESAQADLKRLLALKHLEAQTASVRRQAEKHRGFAARVALWKSEQQAKRTPFWPLGEYWKQWAILKQIQRRERRAAQQAEVSQQRLASLERRLESEQAECAPLQQRYPDVLLPDDSLDLEAAEVQRTSFGHCKALNQARGKLTACAFELHQAWLVALYADRSNQLVPTINALMPMLNGKIDDRDAAKALWQMLFMIVPVVSSTFASTANQFKALNEGEIGWLFIDEAGQASPQQAVGALWRARRAIVVGDPLQIEPVFTVPAELVEAMAKGEFERDWYKWSPTVSSVQVVADRANPYGTKEISDAFWVGSPLRVHRRCDEPMFSIANRIAYNDKMLHGNDSLPPGPGDSRWFEIDGNVSGKHFVPAQAAKVASMLKPHIERTGAPPNVYVISPFKAVAQGVRQHLERELPAAQFGGQDNLRNWLKARVGTVHTFQGKEEDNVILVLGLSRDSPGAAEWAASKPNLLNVALTRAKKRVYIVGSTDIWANKKYFSEAKAQLPVSTSK